MLTILPAAKKDLHSALTLLNNASLPTKDIGEHTRLYTLKEGPEVVGTIGLEHDKTTALLRSLSVAPSKRGKGYGEQLVRFVEDIARQKGIQSIFLLTTTAADFFNHLGYEKVSRSDVSPFVQQTAEYCSICPASATVMKKVIA